MKLYSKPVHLPFFIVLIAGALGAVLFAHSALLGSSASQMHIDSQVYIYAAQQILKGKVLYRDVFDHKGPVMYLYECAGIALSRTDYTGLWFLQLLVFTAGVSPLFIYWAKKISLSSSLIAFLFMLSWIFRTKTIGDNLPEIPAVSLICLIFFLCLKIKESKMHERLYSFLTGAAGMGLFLLKPNLTVVILPCLLWLCIVLSGQKRLAVFLTFSLSGCILLLLPMLLYFAWHNALGDAIFAYWTFNFSYLSDQKLSAIDSILQVFFRPVNYLLVFVLLTAALKFIFYKNEKQVFIWVTASLLLSVAVLVGLSGRGSESVHYAIPLAPLVACLLVYITQKFNKFQMIIMFCIALYFCKPVFLHFISEKKAAVSRPESTQYVIAHKKPGETLCVFGNQSSLYRRTGLDCNTPYFYIFPIAKNCNSTLTQRFAEAFDSHKADWIVHERQYRFDTCIMHILKDYRLMATTQDEQVYHLK